MRATAFALTLALAVAASTSARAETEAPLPPKPWLGIGFDDDGGRAQVSEVYPGTAAAAAGLVPGDVITEVDDMRLSPALTLPQLVCARSRADVPNCLAERRVGQRITLTVERRDPDGGASEMKLTSRLSAMPTPDELVYRRLFDRALPGLEIFDRHGAAVPVADWTRRPQVWMVFDARCESCGAASAALRARLASSDDGAADAPLRTVVLGQHVELGAYMARVPLMGTVWRIDRGEESRRNVFRYFLSGIQWQTDGVVLVIDHRGIVRFATAISVGESAHDGACAAVARAMRAWRP